MAASWLEVDDGGLKLEPNFELLAILLALALQEEDAERFIEVYDHIVPTLLSVVEVERLKDRSRELSDLPTATLLELKANQEKRTTFVQSSTLPGVTLESFVANCVDDSKTIHVQTENTNLDRGKFLTESGALLSHRLGLSAETTDSGTVHLERGSCPTVVKPLRVDTASQIGAPYINRDIHDVYTNEDVGLTPRDSYIVPSRWSAMESDSAHNKVQKAPQTKSRHGKKSIPSSPDPVFMNGNTLQLKATTTDKSKHCVKSKPPQKVFEANSVSPPTGHYLEESACNDINSDSTKEERAALLPKSPPVPTSPPYKSIEEVHQSVEKLLPKTSFRSVKDEKTSPIPKSPSIPKSPPFKSFQDVCHSVEEILPKTCLKSATCPPPLFLSQTTATLAHPNQLVDGSSTMAFRTETKCSTFSYENADTVQNFGSSYLTKVPSPVNKSSPNDCSTRPEATNSTDIPEFDGDKYSAKKKKKKKKSKISGNKDERMNSIKLPVGAAPHLPHLPVESSRPSSSSRGSRHPSVFSSDSVTSSGDSSTDGGACVNDMSTKTYKNEASTKEPILNNADSSDDNTYKISPREDLSRSDVRLPSKKGSLVKNNLMVNSSDLKKPNNQFPKALLRSTTLKSNFSDSEFSYKTDAKPPTRNISFNPILYSRGTVGKIHSLSAPTATTEDNDDNDTFIKVKSKRMLRSAKKRGSGDDSRFTPPPGRYFDRDSYRRNFLAAGLRKSTSEPAGMSHLGDKDTDYIDKSKVRSEKYQRNDKHYGMSSVNNESPAAHQSYANMVKSNIKTSSLPLKFSPKVMLDYRNADDDHSDNQVSEESDSKSPAWDSKAVPFHKSVLDGSNVTNEPKKTTPQQMKRNPAQVRFFQRSCSVDASEATKKMSSDDTSIRNVPPRGPEATVQYLDLHPFRPTYASRLKQPTVPKTIAPSHLPPAKLELLRTPIAGLKDLKHDPNQRNVTLNRPSTPHDPTKVNTRPVVKPLSKPSSSADVKSPVLRPKAPQVPTPPARIAAASPTPSTGSSTSKPFDMEPQDNFEITFGSVIVGPSGYKILEEAASGGSTSGSTSSSSSIDNRGNAIRDLLSKVKVPGKIVAPNSLQCSELEKTFMLADSAGRRTTAGNDSPTLQAVTYTMSDKNSTVMDADEDDYDEDDNGDFNHLDVAGMLWTEWCTTKAEMAQNTVKVIGAEPACN